MASGIFVTVGMGPWPFDRLLRSVVGLINANVLPAEDVFVQRGTSTLELPCASKDFIGATEFQRRLRDADVVITHAGNTVRVAQRMGHIPIAVAREAGRGEMSNDHQVRYLHAEERTGRVVAVWDVSRLADVLRDHSRLSSQLNSRSMPATMTPEELADRMDCVLAGTRTGMAQASPGWDDAPISPVGNPFAEHPVRRYAYAYAKLAFLPGPHLDIGTGLGDFAGNLQARTGREVHAVDPHPGYLSVVRERYPALHVQQVSPDAALPFRDASFGSVSVLDALEHVPDESALLAEVFRVLRPGGTAVITVPHWHLLSTPLDPDNAKFRLPRLHRIVYTLRYGARAYKDRFLDLSNGLRGDISVDRGWHTNYRMDTALRLVRAARLQVVEVSGANFLWRLLQIPAIVLPHRVGRMLRRAVVADGKAFTSPHWSANLFMTVRRSDAGT